MTVATAILLGVFAAAFAAAAVRRRGVAAAHGRPEEPVRRELRELRADLASGELERGDYELMRDRLAARMVAGERPAPNASGRRARPRWRLPAIALVAAGVIVATLVPALRQRGASDYITGNDFATAADSAGSALAAWQAAEQAMRAGDPGRAVERYRMAVAFVPDRPDLRARFGLALALDGRRDEALRQLRLAAREAPALAETRLYLGAVLLRAGRREAGEAQFRRYLRLAPGGQGAEVARRTLRSLER